MLLLLLLSLLSLLLLLLVLLHLLQLTDGASSARCWDAAVGLFGCLVVLYAAIAAAPSLSLLLVLLVLPLWVRVLSRPRTRLA